VPQVPGKLESSTRPGSVDLEEFKLGFVDCAAVAVARGEVGDDRSMVGIWPGGPLDVDVGAGGNNCRERGVSAVTVADDIGGLVFGAIFEAEVGGCCGPADAFGWVGFIDVFIDKVAGVAGDVSVVLFW
jgi:hypothetical protein